jgi:hypothetical protein
MVVALLQPTQNLAFFLVHRTECCVARLSLQRNVAAARRNQSGNTQPGAGTDHAIGAAKNRGAAANLLQFIRAQGRYCKRKRGKVVDDL